VDAGELSPTAYVVLGLVSLRPRAGHELAGFAERSIGNFFPLTRSHIHAELDRLCREGLLEASEVRQERFPTKRVYAITREGEGRLGHWLEESPVGPDRQRNLFLVRVFFGDRMSPARLGAILDEYEAYARERRDRLAVVVDRLSDRPGAAFGRATAMFGVRKEQAKLDWVAEVRPLLLSAAGCGSARRGGACSSLTGGFCPSNARGGG
jgi:DNA-binding PadR family transcriptional regulator